MKKLQAFDYRRRRQLSCVMAFLGTETDCRTEPKAYHHDNQSPIVQIRNRITLHPPTCRSAVYFRNWSAVPVAGLGSWMSKSSECSELYLYLQQRVCRRAEANGESIFGCLCLIFSCSLFSTLPNHLNQGNPFGASHVRKPLEAKLGPSNW